jgi:hypothetical protein
MEHVIANRPLYGLMSTNSMLSRDDPAQAEAFSLIFRKLVHLLESDEDVLAYADRELVGPGQTDILGGETGASAMESDALGYDPGGPSEETDAFSGDTGASWTVPDVMGYQPGGPEGQTDALDYSPAPRTPQTDAFTSSVAPRATDVDFLVLTARRLVRGFLEDEKIMFTEAPMEAAEVRLVGSRYIAVKLPPALRGLGEGEWWSWRVPDGTEPRTAAKAWSRSGR